MGEGGVSFANPSSVATADCVSRLIESSSGFTCQKLRAQILEREVGLRVICFFLLFEGYLGFTSILWCVERRNRAFRV